MAFKPFAGGETEDTRTADVLAIELRKLGLGVRTLPKFIIRTSGKPRLSKPDVEVTDGGVNIISAKFGEGQTFEAYRTATEFKAELPLAVEMEDRQLGEVFAITYPIKKREPFHLYILPREGRHREIALAPQSAKEAAKAIQAAIAGKFDDLVIRSEPIADVATRVLYYGALEMADAIHGAKEEELEAVFGGHDFFKSVLSARLKGKKRNEALRTGPAFLFVNQLLFYVLLSEADRESGHTNYPPINEEDASAPLTLQTRYFERVRLKNYEPIYGIDVAHLFTGKRAESACRGIVQVIQDFVPSLETPDLIGQVFQTLIPFDIRKPLGAHYTNPKAAALLAGLAIDDADTRAIDPACGSGTLLVSTYRRKRQLLPKSSSNFHKRFVEDEITGLDAMAFSAHLAAVNLALQSPLQDTDHVRVGTCDSTHKRPGDDVSPTEDTLSWQLKQTTLLDKFDKRGEKRKISGPVKTTKHAPTKPFKLFHANLVIMNPPFTSWDNMARNYREGLVKMFSNEKKAFAAALYWKTSQQSFFVLLADSFLQTGGRVAAVLPFTTFTGKAFDPLLRFLLENYTVRYIVIGLGRASFSEQTSLTECLLVADKVRPNDCDFLLVGTLRSPEDWTDMDVQTMVMNCKRGLPTEQESLTMKYKQNMLLPENETLSGLLFRLVPSFNVALTSAENIRKESKIQLVKISALIKERGLDMKRWVLGGGYLASYAPKALFVYRSVDRAIREVDRLVVQQTDANTLTVGDKEGGVTAKVPSHHLVPCLRRLTHLPTIDVSQTADYCFYKADARLRELIERYYGKADGAIRWKRITEGGKETLGVWENVVPKGLCKVALARRVDLAGPGTHFVSCRSSKPFFLAGDAFMVREFKSPLQEKLFTLWLNSSYTLFRLLEKITITRGTWVKFERFRYEEIEIPDFDKLTKEQEKEVEDIYAEFSKAKLVELTSELVREDGPRAKLDQRLFMLVGFSQAEASRIGTDIRLGLSDVIETLRKTMITKPKKKQKTVAKTELAKSPSTSLNSFSS